MANIFIVDDSRTSRKVLRNILEKGGHTIVGEATNGKEAVDHFGEANADLITLDITMPIMDGIEALRKIKEINPNSKVIMVTAAGQKEKVMDAIKAGALEFLSKPFEPEQILEIIERVTK